MAIIHTMPKLTTNSETGYISRWMLKIGDEVKRGDVIAEVSSDLSKRNENLFALCDGIILFQYVYKGVKIPVNSPVVLIGVEDSDIFTIMTTSDKESITIDLSVNDRISKLEYEVEILRSILGQNLTSKDVSLESLKEEIFKLVGNNKLAESFALLLNHEAFGFEFKKNIVLLRSKYNRINKDRHTRMISDEEFAREEASIITYLLDSLHN